MDIVSKRVEQSLPNLSEIKSTRNGRNEITFFQIMELFESYTETLPPNFLRAKKKLPWEKEIQVRAEQRCV